MLVADPANPGVLVSTDWVERHSEDPTVVVVEVNTDLTAGYYQGHVPGAVAWNLHEDLEDQTSRNVPGLSQFESLMERSGIDKHTAVVLYGDGNNRSATWAFWILEYYRHADVRLMDGGRKKWIREGRPLSTWVAAVTPTTYRAGVPDASIRAARDRVLTGLRDPNVILLDTRTPEEYSGKLASAPGTDQSGVYRKGRIPGAVHVQWDDGAAADGSFLPTGQLAKMYRKVGAAPDREIVPYCRLGVRASYTWFVLKRLLGYERVRNYDGSWTEWGNSAGVPVETDSAAAPAQDDTHIPQEVVT